MLGPVETVGRGVVRPESLGELRHDAIREGVRHGEDLGEDVVEGCHICVPVLLTGDRLSLGEREVLGEEVAHVVLGPAGVGVGQKGGVGIGVGVPPLVVAGECPLVPLDGRGHQVDGDEDVVLQEPGQLLPGSAP